MTDVLTDTGTGVCSHCDGTYRLRPDGTLVRHGLLAHPCPGSTLPPAGAEPADDPPEAPVFDPVAIVITRSFEPRPDWFAEAACRPELRPPDVSPQRWTGMFFPGRGASLAEARDICRVCPVRGDCKVYAVEHREHHGVWGGASERDRRRMRRRAR